MPKAISNLSIRRSSLENSIDLERSVHKIADLRCSLPPVFLYNKREYDKVKLTSVRSKPKPTEKELFNDLFEGSLLWRESSFENYPEIKHLSKVGVFIHEIAGQNYAKCFHCRKDLLLLPGYRGLKLSTFHRTTCSYHNNQLEMNIDVNNKSEKRFVYNVLEDEIDAKIDSPQIIKMLELFNVDREIIRNHVKNQLKSKGVSFRSSYELILDVLQNVIKHENYLG